ncbi:MAG: hypothetical protein NVSMB64_17090 [Candidatus Velthaea sp.]
MLARSGATTTYFWDATTYVAQLVTDGTLGAAGQSAIEATAISILAEKAKASNSRTIAISVFYSPPAASSIYGRPTFADQQKLFVLSAARTGMAKSGAAWAQSAANGSMPNQIKIEKTGTLPPAQ